MIRIVSILLLLTAATLIPLNFPKVITFSVIHLHLGWVFATFFTRLVVIILFILALNIIFSYFKRTQQMKFAYVILIGLLPGFALSFLSPIYNTDYGDLSDEMVLDSTELLTTYTKGGYDAEGKRHIVAFFSTSCGHCQNVAAKIGINQKGGQKIGVWAFFMEEPPEIVDFLAACHGQDFDAFQIKDTELYFNISGFEVPSIFLIDRDGTTINHWAGDVVNYTTLDYLREIEP